MTYDTDIHYVCTTFHHLLEQVQKENSLQQELNEARLDFRKGAIDKSTLLDIASACDYEEARLFALLLDTEETDLTNKALIQQLYAYYVGIHTDSCMAFASDDEDEN